MNTPEPPAQSHGRSPAPGGERSSDRANPAAVYTHQPDQPPAPRQDPRLEIPEVLREHAESVPTTGRDTQKYGQYAGASRAWGIGFDFISTILVGVFVGYLLDRWVIPSPVGTLAGLGIGFVLAFIRIIKATQRESRAQMLSLEQRYGISAGPDLSTSEQSGSEADQPDDADS